MIHNGLVWGERHAGETHTSFSYGSRKKKEENLLLSGKSEGRDELVEKNCHGKRDLLGGGQKKTIRLSWPQSAIPLEKGNRGGRHLATPRPQGQERGKRG